MGKPNIIFIMADQLAAGFVGCYGSGVDSTPTLDTLARNGMRFDRCYASIPVCAPNRATLLTGRSSVIHGVVTNNLELTTDNPTYPEVLQQQGYRTGGFGKFHHTSMGAPHPRHFEHFGYDESMVSEDPKWGDYLDWVEREHPEQYPKALAMCWAFPYVDTPLKEEHAVAVRNWLQERRDASEWALMYTSPLPQECHQSTYITNRSLDFMSRSIQDAPEDPFFCYISYVDPHDPYDPPEPYDRMFSPEDMPEPLPASWTERGNSILEQSQTFCHFDSISEDVDALKKMRALYHGSLRLVDDQVARVVRFLEEHQLTDDTIIVFTTDHGDMMGDHGLITKGVKFYDKGIRCPLIVSGKNIPSGVCDELVCSLDFFPTLCDWGGASDSQRPPLEGKSFAQACLGQTLSNPWSEVAIESPHEEGGHSVRGIVTDDHWRFTIFDADDTGEMFDLSKDPDEQNNLFYDPAFTDQKLRLYERLTRAFMRSHQVVQYRNLSEVDGQKCVMDKDCRFHNTVFQR